MPHHRKPTQAVLVIHGIGEQRPMATLKGFAESVLPPPRAGGRQYFSKPDRLSGSFELRRLKAVGDRRQPRTDFFEYYWAFNMRDTEWRHLWSWVRGLLLTSPGKRVAWRIRALRWLSVLSLAAAVLIGVTGVASPWISWFRAAAQPWSWPAMLVSVLVAVMTNKALFVIGDAARYLEPSADNYESREAVRKGGVALLRKLQKSDKYERIIVVGHSLGSVIAYDIVRFAWEEFRHSYTMPPDNVGQKSLQRLEGLAAEMATVAEGLSHAAEDREMRERLSERAAVLRRDYREEQRLLWQELRRLGLPWKVTDLVTMGSPLAHAPYLISECDDGFEALVADEGLPTCPPVVQRRGHFSYRDRFEFACGPRAMRVLTEGAPFAPVRWTNVFYPGDIIAGPVAPVFGLGVQDRCVEYAGGPVARMASKLPGTHTRYWNRRRRRRAAGSGRPKPEFYRERQSVAALRNAMALWDMPLMIGARREVSGGGQDGFDAA